MAVWSAVAGAATVSRAAQRITRFMADTPDLVRIVNQNQALAEAREKGLEDVDQTGHAVRVVLAARPEMTTSAALQAVNQWRRG